MDQTKHQIEGSPLLNTRQATERINRAGIKMAEPTLDLHRYNGAIAYMRVGGGKRARVRFTEADVDEFVASRVERIPAKPQQGLAKAAAKGALQ